jgi:phage terminase small subunit
LTQPKPPRAPNGLKRRGSVLFKQITATYVVDGAETVLLHELCRTVDRIEAIEAKLARDGLTVTGNRGQIPRAHPLLVAQAEAQRTVSRLVAELALPAMPEQVERPRPGVLGCA